jgi:hypothetical protein
MELKPKTMKRVTLFTFCLVLGLSFFITNCETSAKKDDSIKTESDKFTYSTEVINLKVDSVGVIYDLGGFNHAFEVSINKEKSAPYIKVFDIAFGGEVFTQCIVGESIQIVVTKVVDKAKKKESYNIKFRKGLSEYGVYTVEYPDTTGFPNTLNFSLDL